MKYTQASLGRIFILRLEQGDKIPDTIESFAQEKDIKSAAVFFIGGADKGSKVVVGPRDGAEEKPVPVVTTLSGTSESVGIGTIFRDEKNFPKLHLHSSFGHGEKVITGCTRKGVDIWLYGEIIIMEIVNDSSIRKIDKTTGFELLEL